MRKIILLIRRSKGYFLDGTFDKEYFEQYPAFKDNLMIWSLFLKMPYLKFRKRLTEISSLTYKNNNFDHIFLWGDYDKLQDYNENTFVVAADEDDWLSDNLVDSLMSVAEKENITIRWKVININYNGSSEIEQRDLCRSCGYATKLPFPIKYIKTNVFMSGRRDITLKINDILSVKVDNVSSISFWENGINICDVIKNKYFVEKTELVKKYWYLVDLYNELLNDLYQSSKI